MGAWYVISSMGLFDVKGLTDPNPSFSLGATLFDKVTIHLNKDYYEGDKFVIKSNVSSAGKAETSDDSYVKSYLLNGEKLDGQRINFSDVVKGGELEVLF